MSEMTVGTSVELTQSLLHLDRFVGLSEQAQEARAFAMRVAKLDQTVLLRGETGSGKDHLAEIIHLVGRPGRPFVTVDCGALPETLLEAELFGHSKGAFTGAASDADGLLRTAEDGTIFVNEVGNMGLTFQAKLLGVLDGKPFRPIGGGREYRVEARIVAATNADLEKRVARSEFRADLFHRLNGLPFFLAPLRERKEDIPLLLSSIVNGESKRFSPRAMDVLKRYDWPGNVREFTQVVRRAVVMIDDEIDGHELEKYMKIAPQGAPRSEQDEVIFPAFMPTLPNLEEAYFRKLFDLCGGNKKKMAAIAGVSLKTVYNRAREYRLRSPVTGSE